MAKTKAQEMERITELLAFMQRGMNTLEEQHPTPRVIHTLDVMYTNCAEIGIRIGRLREMARPT